MRSDQWRHLSRPVVDDIVIAAFHHMKPRIRQERQQVFSGMFAGSGQVSNSQCTLHGAGSGGVVSGSTLTITYNLDFSAAFAGTKKAFMQAVDNTGVIEVWHQVGTWTR